MDIQRYGYNWPFSSTESKEDCSLKIEMGMIKGGLGPLPVHYENMCKLLWPHIDDHRWHILCRDEVLKNQVTVLAGSGSSGKTNSAAWIYLCEYFVFPDDTCILVSSTDMRGLRMRVWGEITQLWQQATDRFPWLPGHLLDSRVAITTDLLDDGDFEDRRVRDMRKGIIGIPCMQGGKFVGLGKYIGIKQKRLRLLGDELQFMGSSFLSAMANLDKNEDFRACLCGNFNDPLDCLGRAAEPRDGWTTHMEPERTAVWDTRFMNGRCVNLIGPDSPNFDFPTDQPTRYKYLISREKIANTLSFFSKDSVEYYSQCVGSMKVGVLARRVITRDLCIKFGALEDVIWEGEVLTKLCALDAAYGGDRCVCIDGEFGKANGGKIVLKIYPPQIVPISVRSNLLPEDQIADWVKAHCESESIAPANFFHDSTGRGTLGTSLARIWSVDCNPVEFGGQPTDRPVSLDMYIFDPITRQRRLLLCSEHYRKFVTELWWSVRYAIEAGQLKNLSEDVMEEGCMREWDKTKDNKIELETKLEMKERVGRSPDLFDALTILVEGARRRGFQIAKLANQDNAPDRRWFDDLAQEQAKMDREHELCYD